MKLKRSLASLSVLYGFVALAALSLIADVRSRIGPSTLVVYENDTTATYLGIRFFRGYSNCLISWSDVARAPKSKPWRSKSKWLVVEWTAWNVPSHYDRISYEGISDSVEFMDKVHSTPPSGALLNKRVSKIELKWYWPMAWVGFTIPPAIVLAGRSFRRFRRKKRYECIQCGYSLKGLTDSRCPECGFEE